MTETLEARAARYRAIQWIMAAAWVLATVGFFIMEARAIDGHRRSPAGCAWSALTAFVHGVWVTLDCKIRNRRVAAWRFAAFFLGPLALWTYFIVEYRARALVLIPASLIVYAMPIGMLELIGRVAPHFMP